MDIIPTLIMCVIISLVIGVVLGIHDEPVNNNITIVTPQNLTYDELNGTTNAFVCVYSNGTLYRSMTACL